MITVALGQPRWQKEIYDQLNLFLGPGDFGFDPQGQDLVIKEDRWTYQGQTRTFASKQELKRGLFQALSQLTGRRPPWGILTGVRPVKLLYYIEEAQGREAVARVLAQDYLVQEEKIQDLLAIRAREEALRPWDKISYYFHLPFCDSRCSYCTFTSYIGASPTDQARYVRALVREFKASLQDLPRPPTRSLYLGGGTPTALDAGALAWLLGQIRQVLPEEVEFTVEAGRVDSLSPEKLALLKDQGVNRLCVNPQTFDPATLRQINRYLPLEDFQRAMDLVASYDFPSINLDLILGLPGEDQATMEASLAQALAFQPDNLSLHTLAYKKGSQVKREDREGREVAGAWAQARQDLAGRLEPYYLYRQKNSVANLENIGFARAGRACAYNMVMMDELESVLAFGASANSKILGPDRTQTQLPNPKSLAAYYDQLEEIIRSKRSVLGGGHGQ